MALTNQLATRPSLLREIPQLIDRPQPQLAQLSLNTNNNNDNANAGNKTVHTHTRAADLPITNAVEVRFDALSEQDGLDGADPASFSFSPPHCTATLAPDSAMDVAKQNIRWPLLRLPAELRLKIYEAAILSQLHEAIRRSPGVHQVPE